MSQGQLLGYDPETGKAVYATPEPKEPKTDTRAPGQRISDTMTLGAIGAGKATGRTVVNLAKVINWLSSFNPSGVGISDAIMPGSLDLALSDLEPLTPAEKTGGIAADVGTAMVAGGPLTAGSRAAASMAPRLLRPLVRAGVDAATSAGLAAAQGQEPGLAAVMGGLGGAALGTVDDAAMAARAARGVENRNVRALAPPGRGTPQRVAQEQIRQVSAALAREPGMGGFSRATVLTKVSNAMDEAETAMDAAAAQVSKTKAYDTNGIYKAIQRLRNQITAKGVVAQPARDAALASMQAEIKALGPNAPYSALAKLRRGWQKAAADSKVYAQDAAGVALKDAGRAKADVASILVDTMAAGEPGMQAANSRWSFLKKARDAMQLAEEIEQTNPRALRGVIARTGGAMAGGGTTGTLTGTALGAIIGNAVEKAMHGGPTVQIATARSLAKLEDALRAGKWADVETALTTLRLAGQAAFSPSHGGER